MFLELIYQIAFSSIIVRKSYLMKSIQEHLSFIFQTVSISKMQQLSLCIYVLFGYFKQINQVQDVSQDVTFITIRM